MATIDPPKMAFNRVVSAALETALVPTGALRPLVDCGLADPRVDVQLRTQGSTSWATLYCGLTSVLDIIESKGRFRLRAAEKHKGKGKFDEEWTAAVPIVDLQASTAAVLGYLGRILDKDGVDARYTNSEGQVQTDISRAPADDFGMFQREALPSFRSTSERTNFVDPLLDREWDAMQAADERPDWWPGVRDNGKKSRSGLETDLVGIDNQGRLLVVEVKPSSEVKGLAWAPGQVRLYSEVLAAWASTDPEAASSINGMADQRERLGLPVTAHRVPTNAPIRILPVIAVGPTPMKALYRDRMQRVHDQLMSAPLVFGSVIDPVELWEFDEHGVRTKVTPL